ncbi:hypothetical protein [Colwellia sp. E2M01]|uniref:hypothetical protein n=1 Tax=Colwellia sp. E2M01 TaxID=2841561 RepID=UPI001C091B47|nr:hypothetical protein [Colwellia sp. E2M01]MBU2871389.1 hypothetical protein [Colwellia sp. E2M01]
MYLSRTDLKVKEGLSVEEASEVWSKYYFYGWNNSLTWVVTALALFAIYFFSLPSWSVATSLLLIHSLVALPLATKEMRNYLQTRKSGER